MNHEMTIREVFKLINGTTVLACEGSLEVDSLVGRRALLIAEGKVPHGIVLTGERLMLNSTKRLDQRALETLDAVSLPSEEVRSGKWRLVLE